MGALERAQVQWVQLAVEHCEPGLLDRRAPLRVGLVGLRDRALPVGQPIAVHLQLERRLALGQLRLFALGLAAQQAAHRQLQQVTNPSPLVFRPR